ncbi:hypothetical protein [Stenotrophomonas sp. PS02289]|uniref:hypothetical protein n=1 Tax=Stenotrophomonas sp. PS02289 TaxID=2991422 RepID=UPI00249C7DBC|nr:hypothetical protein [Stenotrophomonas sp. PS02289]
MKSVAWVLAGLIMLLPVAAGAEDSILPQGSASKQEGEFSASLLITDDPDWQQEWEAPKGEVPNFRLADSVSAGGDLYVLAFVSNPKLDEASMTNVRCDLKVAHPDGTLSSNDHDLPCFVTRLESDPKRVYLSSVGLKFTAEEGDATGTWTVSMTVHDKNRGVTLPLEAAFELR